MRPLTDLVIQVVESVGYKVTSSYPSYREFYDLIEIESPTGWESLITVSDEDILMRGECFAVNFKGLDIQDPNVDPEPIVGSIMEFIVNELDELEKM